MKRRSLAAAALFTALVASAVAGEVEYRMTRCTSSGEGRFSVAFEGPRKEQRRIALSSNRLTFGGNVKGQVALSDVRELRLSPVLQVVFTRAENKPLKFGAVSAECRRLIQNEAGLTRKVRDGKG
jgi:hypothetical protein